MKRRILALALAALMVLSLAACGGKPSNAGTVQTQKNEDNTVTKRTVWYLGGNDIMAGDVDVEAIFADVADTIDPAQIYASVTITEDMIHGAYTLNNQEKDIARVRKEIPLKEVQLKDNALVLSILPTAVYFGAEYICSSGTNYKYSEFEQVADNEVAVIEFATEDKVGQTTCTYEISGKTITFKQIEMTSAEGEPFAYDFTGVEFVYDFNLSGPYMTFSKDGYSLSLKAFCLTENTNADMWLSGYSLPDSPLAGELDYFSASDAWNYAVKRNGEYYDISAYKMDDAGRFTMYLAEQEALTKEIVSAEVSQYAYIIQSSASSFLTDFSIVLMDGQKVCYYTDDITQREARALEEQGVDVSTMEEDQIKEIAEKKADLFDDLYAAFQEQGINATVNRSTGEIALDSTILFGVNESQISEEGKAFLQQFMQVYTSVVFSDKYTDFVSKIMVEGHTDTSGEYEMNLELSQARADSVSQYCQSAECGVDAAYTAALNEMLQAVGYSYDKPVYDSDGNVDMDASRRVSFRFVINVG